MDKYNKVGEIKMKYRYEAKELLLIGNDLCVTNDSGEKLRMPRMYKSVDGILNCSSTENMVDTDIKKSIHNLIKECLANGREINFSYTENTEYDSDEFWNMLTDRPYAI